MSDQMTGQVPLNPAAGIDQALRAIEQLAIKAQAAESMAEAKDAGQAALAFAQTIITLDPTRLAGGDTPDARLAAAPKPPPTRDGDKDGKIGS